MVAVAPTSGLLASNASLVSLAKDWTFVQSLVYFHGDDFSKDKEEVDEEEG